LSYLRRAVIALLGLAMATTPANAHPRESSAGTPVSMEGNFAVVCTYSHTKAVDPIMAFGQRPSPHAHDFFGAIDVHARSTRRQLRSSPTTCQDKLDTSGYWEPEPFFKGHHVPAAKLLAYYYGGPDTIVPPFGLKMMAGSPHATRPLPTGRIAWSCGNGSGTISPRMNHPYKCLKTPGVVNPRGVTGIVIFPSCWDGKGLRPMDVVYPVDHRCRRGTYLIPQLQERYQFPFMDGTKLSFVTGKYTTFHADFFQTWHGLRLRHLVAVCLRASVACGKVT
jgi:hypothetical protein